MWENSVGGLREYQRALVGDPVADRAAYEKQSPMTYAKNIRVPLLNLQGENDVRVPKGQTDEVVKLIKANGGIVDAVYYPAEGHGFNKRENREKFAAADAGVVRPLSEGAEGLRPAPAPRAATR